MSMNQNPRFLLLHGWRTNGSIMRKLLDQSSGIPKSWEINLPNAPFPAKGPPQPVVQKYYPNQEYFEWFDSEEGKDGKVTYVGVEESIKYVQQIVLKHGPFDGLIGFSQGGILATLLTGIMESDPNFLPPNFRWSCTIPISAVPVRDARYAELFAKQVETPSIHLIGDSDGLLERNNSLIDVYAKSTRTVLRHPGGHTIPKQLEVFRDTIQPYTRYWWAFDFDGVLCDSAVETGISGWKSAKGLIEGASNLSFPPTELQEQFRRVRPVLETGFQAILLMYLLNSKEASVDQILANPIELMQQAQDKLGVSDDELKERFHAGRNEWIARNEDEWLSTHQFFEDAVATTKLLVESKQQVYIITTKHADFANKLLAKCGIQVPENQVFGLGSGKKLDVMTNLSRESVNVSATPVFIEDRLKTLLGVRNGRLTCRYALASWGYNTEGDRSTAVDFQVPVVSQAEWNAFVFGAIENRT